MHSVSVSELDIDLEKCPLGGKGNPAPRRAEFYPGGLKATGSDIFISVDILDKLMESEGIYLKRVDRRMYRKLKAMAAENGLPVYKVLNDAIAAYLRSAQSALADESVLSLEDVDNIAYEAIEIGGASQGQWTAIADGKVVGTTKGIEEVIMLMRERYSKAPYRHGIIAHVGQAREEHEWLAGSLQKG